MLVLPPPAPGRKASRLTLGGEQILKGRFRGWELKPYFNVTNSYVVNKLFLVLFPWRHKPWSRKTAAGREGWYLPPRDDVNSPDMYIPVMSFVTYIFLRTLIAGLRGEFEPELFGYTATTASIIMFLEILGLKLGCYLLSISNESQLLDLVAYSGYKFVGVIVTISIAEIVNGGKGTGGWVGWMVFLYTFLANSLFLVSQPLYRGQSWMLTIVDAIPQVCVAPREQQRQPGSHAAHANRHAGQEEPEDAVSLFLFVCCAAAADVDLDPSIDGSCCGRMFVAEEGEGSGNGGVVRRRRRRKMRVAALYNSEGAAVT